MKKEFLLNLILLVGINLLIKPFYAFGIDLQVQNRVGSTEYGLYFALFNFSYLFQIISDMGIQQYNSRFIAQQPHLLKKYFPHFLALKGILSVLFLLSSLITAFFLGYLNAKTSTLLIPLLINQILITLIFYLRSNLAGLQFFRTDSFISALDKLILILLMIFLLWGPIASDFTIVHFVYAQSISFGLTALIIIILLYGKIRLKIVPSWNPNLVWAILKKSWPFALAVFLMTAYTRTDAVMIERMLPDGKGSYESGVYAFGYRLLDIFNMIGYLFAGLLLPMYAKMLQKKEVLTDLLKTAFQFMFFITASLSFSVFFFSWELSEWMLKDAGLYNAEVFSLLIWSSISSGMIYIFGSLLTANASLKQMNRIFGIGLILNIIGNLITIPLYGAWGAALCTVSTQSFVALSEIYLVYRNIKLSRDFFKVKELFRPFLLCLGLFLIYGMAYYYLNPFIDWRVSFLLATAGSLAWAETVGALELMGFLKILRQKNQ